MAVLTPSEFETKWHSIFLDNSTREIVEEDMRNFVTDVKDSFVSGVVGDSPENYDDWDTDAEYYIGNKVTEDNRIWKSLTGTSGSPNTGNQPSLSPDDWEEVSEAEAVDLDFLAINTSTAVVFNMGGRSQRSFASSVTIDGARTWSFTNDTNALFIPAFTFQINVGAAQTLPTDSKVAGNERTRSEFGSGIWTPTESGQYMARANKGQNVWWWTIEGPIAQ